jgi:hypothetical protein
VKCVRVVESNKWEIDPPQWFKTTRAVSYENAGTFYAGSSVEVIAIVDDCLEPWRDHDWSGEDESARYLPAVPKTTAPMVKEPA